MSFEHQGLAFNLLDTPGHQDFSEDTAGASSATPRNSSRTPEIVERIAEIDRRQIALAIGLRVEWRAEAARHLDLLAQFGECRFRQTAGKLGVVEAIAADRLDDSVVDTALEQ
jgi:hypothetical protein